jgi:ring-1,2-phenylacetyl-CoA epoxidase subunit PaaC
MPYALGIFEPSPFEEELIKRNIFEGERHLQAHWLLGIESVLNATELRLPDLKSLTPAYGGRVGKHSIHLQPLLDEMSEVFKLDPTAEW